EARVRRLALGEARGGSAARLGVQATALRGGHRALRRVCAPARRGRRGLSSVLARVRLSPAAVSARPRASRPYASIDRPWLRQARPPPPSARLKYARNRDRRRLPPSAPVRSAARDRPRPRPS